MWFEGDFQKKVVESGIKFDCIDKSLEIISIVELVSVLLHFIWKSF